MRSQVVVRSSCTSRSWSSALNEQISGAVSRLLASELVQRSISQTDQFFCPSPQIRSMMTLIHCPPWPTSWVEVDVAADCAHRAIRCFTTKRRHYFCRGFTDNATMPRFAAADNHPGTAFMAAFGSRKGDPRTEEPHVQSVGLYTWN